MFASAKTSRREIAGLRSCPTHAVTAAQMALFDRRARHLRSAAVHAGLARIALFFKMFFAMSTDRGARAGPVCGHMAAEGRDGAVRAMRQAAATVP